MMSEQTLEEQFSEELQEELDQLEYWSHGDQVDVEITGVERSDEETVTVTFDPPAGDEFTQRMELPVDPAMRTDFTRLLETVGYNYSNASDMVGELEAFGESDNFGVYADRKSGGEAIDTPREDMIQLLETPKSEWRDVNDGFNEVEEAKQAISFISRMKAGENGDAMPGTDPPLSRRDASLANWGFDASPGEKSFEGDRQR